jgi:3-hydroxymyristoyl/3-hydroxydecanoyl-(acyl carrier protein) dehydratase
MLVTGNEILDLIPQKPPMVMVDTLFSCNASKAVTGLMVTKENVFVRNDLFTESGLMENMAQSAALMTGWLETNNGSTEPVNSIGFIGAIKDFRLNFLPVAGSVLRTEIEVLHRIGNALVIHGKVSTDGKIAAECELKIFSSSENQNS